MSPGSTLVDCEYFLINLWGNTSPMVAFKSKKYSFCSVLFSFSAFLYPVLLGLFLFFPSKKEFRYSPSGCGIRLLCGLRLTPHSGGQGSGPTHTQDFLTAKPLCADGFPSQTCPGLGRQVPLAGCPSAQHCSTKTSFSISVHHLSRDNYCLVVAVHRRRYQLHKYYNSKGKMEDY